MLKSWLKDASCNCLINDILKNPYASILRSVLKRTLVQETMAMHAWLHGFRAVNSHALSVSLTPGLYFSRQACKISRMNAKHPAKHVKSHASRKTTFFLLACHFFLKVKTDTRTQTQKELQNINIPKLTALWVPLTTRYTFSYGISFCISLILLC